jgi:hypothetical protein
MTSEPNLARADEPQAMTIDEAVEAFPGRWMLIKVTARNRYDQPAEGVVVANGPTRDSIQDAVMEHLVRRQPDSSYYVTVGYKRLRTREEFEDLVRRTIERDRSRGKKRR